MVSDSLYGLMRMLSAVRLSDAHSRQAVLGRSPPRASSPRASRASERIPKILLTKHVATTSAVGVGHGPQVVAPPQMVKQIWTLKLTVVLVKVITRSEVSGKVIILARALCSCPVTLYSGFHTP